MKNELQTSEEIINQEKGISLQLDLIEENQQRLMEVYEIWEAENELQYVINKQEASNRQAGALAVARMVKQNNEEIEKRKKFEKEIVLKREYEATLGRLIDEIKFANRRLEAIGYNYPGLEIWQDFSKTKKESIFDKERVIITEITAIHLDKFYYLCQDDEIREVYTDGNLRKFDWRKFDIINGKFCFDQGVGVKKIIADHYITINKGDELPSDLASKDKNIIRAAEYFKHWDNDLKTDIYYKEYYLVNGLIKKIRKIAQDVVLPEEEQNPMDALPSVSESDLVVDKKIELTLGDID